MTEREREIAEKINHPLYTVEFLEEWIDRNDNVFINAVAALQAMGAKGFYEAIKQIAKREETAGVVKRLKEAEETIKAKEKAIRERDKKIRELKKKLSDSEIKRSYMIDPMAIGDRHEMGG